MTNIEKVKRILDAGHWVKFTSKDKVIVTFTSYYGDNLSYIKEGYLHSHPVVINDGTIEVIQRIPTPYNPGDKVLVLSNPSPYNIYKEAMVGKVCEIFYVNNDDSGYTVWDEDKYHNWSFPHHCLTPAFDDEEISDLDRIISGKEAKIVIDGKEYTCVIK